MVSQMYMYYVFAREFGFTPEEVRSLHYREILYFMQFIQYEGRQIEAKNKINEFYAKAMRR